jgi:hypothetical protein
MSALTAGFWLRFASKCLLGDNEVLCSSFHQQAQSRAIRGAGRTEFAGRTGYRQVQKDRSPTPLWRPRQLAGSCSVATWIPTDLGELRADEDDAAGELSAACDFREERIKKGADRSRRPWLFKLVPLSPGRPQQTWRRISTRYGPNHTQDNWNSLACLEDSRNCRRRGSGQWTLHDLCWDI